MSGGVQIIDGLVRVPFERFGLQEYDLFLRTKRLPETRVEFDDQRETYVVTAPERFARLLGVDDRRPVPKTEALAGYLWDYQRFIVRRALEAKRYAVWADCGLGKTAMFLEFARHVIARTRGRVLILSPLQIIAQTIEQGRAAVGFELKESYWRQAVKNVERASRRLQDRGSDLVAMMGKGATCDGV